MENLPALPSDLANRKKLSSEDWKIREFSFYQPVEQFIYGALLEDYCSGPPIIDTTLEPLTKKAIEETKDLYGRLLLLGEWLYSIENVQLDCAPNGVVLVQIRAQGVWKKPEDPKNPKAELPAAY
jgi:hypothetical protein